jgi:hypothetical protein
LGLSYSSSTLRVEPLMTHAHNQIHGGQDISRGQTGAQVTGQVELTVELGAQSRPSIQRSNGGCTKGNAPLNPRFSRLPRPPRRQASATTPPLQSPWASSRTLSGSRVSLFLPFLHGSLLSRWPKIPRLTPPDVLALQGGCATWRRR